MAKDEARKEESPQQASRSSQGKWRNYAVIASGIAVVYGAAALLGHSVRNSRPTTVEAPTSAVASGGKTKLALPVKPTIPVTLTIFEDPRNPHSRDFAQRLGPTLDRLLASGQVQINYRLVTQSDKQYGGSGATEAASAAACAQDQGRLTAYMDQIWKNQPAPTKDTLKNRKLLIALAKKAGKINHDDFSLCVDRTERMGWVKESQANFAAAGLGELPVVQINDRTIPGGAAALTPSKLNTLVNKEVQQVMAAVPATPQS
ncbi:DsbA family protein [Streptomyces albospinus]|uniref:DsbA family protein n=1 Tax=Streptomyces albospinus TaxID=285515 RepID=UPI001E3C3DC0|nr:thioredoxin domain-containing protein [Streptomyces albospinus]